MERTEEEGEAKEVGREEEGREEVGREEVGREEGRSSSRPGALPSQWCGRGRMM